MKNISNKTIRRIAAYAKRQRGLLLFIILFAVIGNILTLTAPTLIGEGIDNIVEAGQVDFSALAPILMRLALVYIGGSLLLWGCAALAVAAANKIVYTLRRDAFEKLSRLPIRFFDSHAHGDIISRLTNDSDLVADGLTQLLIQLFSAVVTVLAALFFMLRLSPLVTLAVVAVTPLVFLVSKTVARLSRSQYRAQQEILGELSGLIHEQLSGQRVVRAFHYEDTAQSTFEEINARLYTVGQKAQLYSSLTNPTTRFVNYISYVLVGLVGAIAAIYYDFTVGGIASFLTYSALFSRPFTELSAITSQLLSALAAAKRLFRLIDEQAEPPETLPPASLEQISGAVDFNGISFSYDPERPLIQDFTLHIPPGSTAAIVGPTGAGKTTMVNLLMRFYDVSSGEIKIDGADISQIERAALRSSFGMVLQDTWLFHGSIRDNIAYGKPEATLDEIITVSKAAGAHSFIKRLAHGYDTVIDEGGENLSQGQRQLITIARAMLPHPPMLILDEATSSVDTLTEQKIQQTFLRMMEGRTSFVIAHRLSTIRNADIIIVMRDGAVIEQGSHEALMQKGGFYASLYHSQFDHTAANDGE